MEGSSSSFGHQGGVYQHTSSTAKRGRRVASRSTSQPRRAGVGFPVAGAPAQGPTRGRDGSDGGSGFRGGVRGGFRGGAAPLPKDEGERGSREMRYNFCENT